MFFRNLFFTAFLCIWVPKCFPKDIFWDTFWRLFGDPGAVLRRGVCYNLFRCHGPPNNLFQDGQVRVTKLFCACCLPPRAQNESVKNPGRTRDSSLQAWSLPKRSQAIPSAQASPGDPRRSEASPGDPRRSQATPSDPKRSQAIPSDPSRSLAIPSDPTDPRRSQASPGDPRRSPAIPGDTKGS
jgi:hypothetical protein